MRKALFIYNRGAGDHSVPRKLDYIIGSFQNREILLQPYRFQSNNGGELLETIREGGFESLIVSGGDGTINFIVNILLKNNINLPVGIIPSGTCNDLAHSLNLPNTINECVKVILEGNLKAIDVGLINEEQYFLSTCAGGVFVDVSYNTHSELKRNFGPFAYYLKGLTEVANIKPFDLKVTTDDGTISEKVLLFLILNGKHGGGFSNLIRQADISDGIMDIVLVKNCLHLDLAALFFKVLSSGSLEDKNVRLMRTRSCRLETAGSIAVSLDGEKGPHLPIDVRYINKALQVFVP